MDNETRLRIEFSIAQKRYAHVIATNTNKEIREHASAEFCHAHNALVDAGYVQPENEE